jgi:putative phosphoribosyl transferase
MSVELFRDRSDAGRRLADKLAEYEGAEAVVLAVPRGGVPVGFEVARRLRAPFDVIIPRKIPIPWNPEAGFGAITADGTMVLNHSMVESLGLSEEEIREAAEQVRQEIVRRTKQYGGRVPMSSIEGKLVILVDDGLASGYTMLAAIESLRKHAPSSIVVAVPVASSGAVRLVASKTDRLVVLMVSHRIPFAVAGFYRIWRDLTDEEVRDYLKRADN